MEHILHKADGNYQVFSLGRSTVLVVGHHWMCLHVLMCVATECNAPSISFFPSAVWTAGTRGPRDDIHPPAEQNSYCWLLSLHPKWKDRIPTRWDNMAVLGSDLFLRFTWTFSPILMHIWYWHVCCHFSHLEWISFLLRSLSCMALIPPNAILDTYFM